MKNKISKKQDIVERFNPRPDNGLTTYQVNYRTYQGLINKSEVKVNRTYFDIIVKNVFTFFNILLLTIGAILIMAGLWKSCAFLIILLINLTISLVQDIRAKRMVDKISLTQKAKIRVVRENKIILIDSDSIVLDDILILKRDEVIPCDAIVVGGEALINESLLTGESVPQKKVNGDLIYSGTYVHSGEIKVRVEHVGKDNYIQELQSQSKEVKRPKSEVYSKLNGLFKIIAVIVMVVGVFMALEYGFIGNAFNNWDQFKSAAAMMAGSLISMIPSGMYLLASTSLTVGILNLLKKKVLVKDMYSIETLARVDTLCIDKTGTITDGGMAVNSVKLFKNCPFNEGMIEVIIGSFNAGVKDANYTAIALKERFGNKKVFECTNAIPFNSVNKYSAASLKGIGTIVIGAPDFVPLKDKKEVEKQCLYYNKQGFRTLVLAYSERMTTKEKIINKIDAIGIIIVQDKVRENAEETIKWFIKNDVDVKVISGDNPITVSKICESIGLPGSNKYVSLEGKSNEEIRKIVENYRVFGRVTPEQKEIIVKALRENKHNVAMFGDGVNDILAMKSADVSISVSSGSRASRDICNLLLLNDDFASLPEIVGQGRRVINNLQRTCSLFLVKTIFSFFMNIFFILFGFITMWNGSGKFLWPFVPNNFHAWEFITIGLAAFFLALEPNNDRLKGSFLKNIFKNALPNGIIMSFVLIGMYLLSFFALNLKDEQVDMTTIAVYFISVCSCIVLFETCWKFNKYRLYVFIGSIVLVGIMFFISAYSNFNILMIEKRVYDYRYALVFLAGITLSFVLMALFKFIVNHKRTKNEN